MSQENEDAQVDVVEQEEQTSVEDDSIVDEGQDEETITIAKSKFNAIRRKAIAYDGAKEKPQIKSSSTDAKWQQKMELKVEGYNDTEVDFILKNGGRKALENPYITSAIDSMRTMKQAEAATLGEQGQKSSVEKRFTPQEFAKLPHAEQLKVLSELK